MSATATVKHLDPTQVELEIAIPQEDLANARERAFQQLVRNARIPGFRPGKVPRKIFEGHYGTAAIEERAMDTVVPDAYREALQANDIEPVDQPQMELLPQEDEGGPLRLRATVAVRPQFTPTGYKGVELQAPPVAITDQDVEKALEQLAKEAGTLTTIDRPVEMGDTPVIDYLGTIDGEPFEGGSAENRPTEIAEGRFIPGFADGIVGMKAGESKDVEATFPADYGKEDLAGKEAVFHITVHENKTLEAAPLDDALAVKYRGEGTTLEELRKDLRARLESGAQDRRRQALANVIVQRVLAANEVPLPEVMVQRETEALEQQARGYIEQAGLSWETYLEGQGKTADDVRKQYREEAEQRVKTTLVLEAIAKVEKVRALPADIEAEVATMSARYGQPREAIMKMLSQNVGALVDGIVRTKTVELMLDQAKIVEVASPV